MSASITGLGQWLPEEVRENSWWPSEFLTRARGFQRELVDVEPEAGTPADAIACRHFQHEQEDPFLGTTRRRVAPPTMTAPEAEALAAEQALQEAGIDASRVDAIFSWAAVPERIVPPSAPKVAELLNAYRAYAVGLDAACASPILQLEVASSLIEAGRAQHVLLTQSHLITRAFARMHPASPNVGDAATAMVVSRAEGRGVGLTHSVTHGQYYPAVTWCRGKDNDTPWWQAGSNFYLGSQDKRGAQELVLGTVRLAAETIRELAERSHTTLQDIDLLACVQPRRWVPQAIAEALGLRCAAPQTFDELAHLGGCGVIVNLRAAREQGLLRPGSSVILYAQGAGFTRAAALVSWT